MPDTTALIFMMEKMEEKLMELMGEEEYKNFSRQIAREAFWKEVDRMDDSDFRRFILESYEWITR